LTVLFINHDKSLSGSTISQIEILKTLSKSKKKCIVISHENLKNFYLKNNLKYVTHLNCNQIPKFNLLSHNSYI
jgi:hypothetical protein